MAGTKGNKNALGNKGGGRSSALDELRNAQWHVGLWEINQQVLELKKKIESNVYSGRDVFALQVLTGKEKAVNKLADKMLPDLVDSDGLRKGFGGLEELFRSMGNKNDE